MRLLTALAALAIITMPGKRTRAETVSVSGEIQFLEKSGKNLYLELDVAGKTVGVELQPEVAKAYATKLKKGMVIGVSGERQKGNKDVAFIVEVSYVSEVKLSGAPATIALGALRLRPDPPPGFGVELIAGFGLWPPYDPGEPRKLVDRAGAQSVGRMVIDTGLTELWRFYQSPGASYAAISEAASAARGMGGASRGVRLAYYLPTFELRREKKDPGSLLACCKSWAQLTLAGQPYLKTSHGKDEFWNKRGDEALWVCPSTPWRREFLARAREAVRRGAEVLFLDTPYFKGSARQMTCRCGHCQARFRRATGLEIPLAPRTGDAAYHRFLAFRHQLLVDFFREVRSAIRRVNPRALLVVEEHPSYRDGETTKTGIDIGAHGAEVDIFAHEYSEQQFDENPFDQAARLSLAASLALYRGIDGRRPTWVLSYARDAKDSRASAAIHLGYDASFWEAKGPEMNDTSAGLAWRRQLGQWLAKNQAAFGSSHQLADVAVLYSVSARDFVPAHFGTLRRVIQVLIAARIPLRVLNVTELALARHYRTLVLPSLEVLSAAHADALRASGARLVAVGQPPSKDEWGVRAHNPRLELERADLLKLPSKLAQQPVLVEREGSIAVNLVQRAGEVQVRLANLGDRPAKLKISVRLAGVRSATRLSLLGREEMLALTRQGDTLVANDINVVDLTLLRLKLQR